jgi:hypothetical protein
MRMAIRPYICFADGYMAKAFARGGRMMAEPAQW